MKICLQRDLIPRHATPRQVNQRFRTLGHHDMWFNVLQDSGIQNKNTLRDNTCQIDYGYMCF